MRISDWSFRRVLFRSDQAVARARHGNGPEDLPAARLQALGRLVEPRVGDRQRRGDDDHGVGKGEEHRADDDADGAVDRLAEQQRLQEALVAEEVNRSEERRGGKGGVRTWNARWAPYH